MDANHKIGVWLDNSHAVFIDPYSAEPEFETVYMIDSAHQRIRGETSHATAFKPGYGSNNEYNTHQKEIQDRKQYLKVITDRLREYDEIFLFGPTDAPRLLHKQLLEEKVFQQKKLSWVKSDKMTDNQLLARVKKHYF